VVLPGAQAPLGFQLTAVLADAFSKLPAGSQYTHLASLLLIAVSIVLLMAPAAFQPSVERGEDSERLHGFSTAMVLTALVPLGLGMAGDVYVLGATGAEFRHDGDLAGSREPGVLLRTLVRPDSGRPGEKRNGHWQAKGQSSRSIIAALAIPPPSQIAARA
jgi:hypothetical protein